MLDDTLLSDWCRQHLDAAPEQVLFRSGHIADVIGVRLAGGLQVVVKARPFQPRITGCVRVQEELSRRGFPCPRPLTGPTRVGELAITAETLVPGGDPRPSQEGAAPFAALLAHLVEAAPAPRDVPDLAPSPPWTGWDHPGQRLWPDVDEFGNHLNEVDGPQWLDDAARRVRERLTSAPRRLCIGHGDWEAQNVRWSGDDALVVHDWDSIIAQPETAIVGLAAAVWPQDEARHSAASVAQTDDFVTAFQHATGRQWDSRAIQDAWAAGLWVRLFDAKQELAEGGHRQVERLADEIDERLERAALS